MPGVLGAIRSRMLHRTRASAPAPAPVRPSKPIHTPARPPVPHADPAAAASTALIAHVLGPVSLRQAAPSYERTALPNLLATCFPADNVDVDLGDFTAYRSMSFALRLAQARAKVQDETLEAWLTRRIDELERGATLAYDLLQRKPLSVLLSAALLAPLSENHAVLVPGGFFTTDGKRADGHAVALYFRPCATTGKTRIAVCNRAAGKHAFHQRDWRQRRMPVLWEVPTSQLLGEAAQPILLEIFRLQRPAPGNSLAAFYEALQQLVDVCGGALLCGKDGHQKVQTVPLAPQTSQKGGTCSWHSAWSWLRVAMELELGDQLPKRRLHNTYKMLKRHTRQVVLDNALQALQEAPNPALQTQLVRVRGWLARHIIHDPALLPLYSDVFLALRKA